MYGHGTIGPLDSLYNRVNTINPLDYDEARSRYSALGTLTGEDQMRATPTLQGATKKFNHAFGEDIGDTADRAGVGNQYRRGMTQYRRAARMSQAARSLGGVAKRVAIPAALGAGGYSIYKALEK